MIDKIKVLKSFNKLSVYLIAKQRIINLEQYKKNFPAFLLHACHLVAYDFAKEFCRNKKVLDIGCFLGYGTKIIADSAREVIAIDTDDKALAFARLNFSSANVKFIKSDAEALLFDNNVFDVVLAFQLIEHISPKKIINFLREVRRVLKGEGLLFLTTPNRKTRLMPLQSPLNPEHYQKFTSNDLKRILEETFSTVEVMGVRGKNWIEEIERNRFKRSYMNSILRIFPKTIRKILQEIKLRTIKNKKLVINKKTINQLEALFDSFSMKDFYLEKKEKSIEKSLDLFAVCSKELKL